MDETGVMDIYIDGSCLPNPGPMGCSMVVLKKGSVVKKKNWKIGNGTAFEAEMYGLIRALEYLEDSQEPATIWTDNIKVKNGFNLCTGKWRKNGFKQDDGSPVSHSDLWAEVMNLKKDTIKIRIISGNTDNRYHLMADTLAKNAVRGFEVDQGRKRARNRIGYVKKLSMSKRRVILAVSNSYIPIETSNAFALGKKIGESFSLGPMWIGRDKLKVKTEDTCYFILTHDDWMKMGKNEVFQKHRKLWSARFHDKSKIGTWTRKKSS